MSDSTIPQVSENETLEAQAAVCEKESSRILIVDDALFMRKKLRKILEDNHFTVVGEADNGQDALALTASLNPDIVTMDITMPGVDGVTSLKAIKKLKPDMKVIMISALGHKSKIMDSLKSGACDFVIKPFVPERVVEVMTRMTAN